MGSPSGGVGGSGGSGNTGGSGGSDNDRGGPSGSGHSGGDDRSSASDGPDSNDRGASRSDDGDDNRSFDNALNDAAGRNGEGDSDANGGGTAGASDPGGLVSSAGDQFGGLVDTSEEDTSDHEADMAAQEAARQSHHANEFSGLGPSSGPADNALAGPDSFNSHRGYGPDGSLAGQIDQDVNAGLEAAADEEADAAQQPDGTDLVGPAGYTAAGLQGGLQAYGDFVDRNARAAAAGTLTNGPAGSLPAPGYANRADLARTITDRGMTANRALDATPYGPNAQSTQQLTAGARTATTFSRVANGAALSIQPAAGAVQGYLSTPENASWTETATNVVVGALKEADDTAVSYGAGWGTTVATAPALGPGAVVAGAGAGVLAGEGWERSSWDEGFDSLVEDYARPAIQTTFDAADTAADFIGDQASGLYDRIFGDDD